MDSVFDWITVLTFCGLSVLYLQRSVSDDPKDKIWQYLPPAIGCMAVNWLGENVSAALGVAGLVGVFAYIYYVLKPDFNF